MYPVIIGIPQFCNLFAYIMFHNFEVHMNTEMCFCQAYWFCCEATKQQSNCKTNVATNTSIDYVIMDVRKPLGK